MCMWTHTKKMGVRTLMGSPPVATAFNILTGTVVRLFGLIAVLRNGWGSHPLGILPTSKTHT
jgi:hypothetical protein